MKPNGEYLVIVPSSSFDASLFDMASKGKSAGKVKISWQVERTDQGDRMRLQWRERDGPLVTPPKRKGLGSRLIEGGLAKELGAEVHLLFDPDGLICSIVMAVLPAPGR